MSFEQLPLLAGSLLRRLGKPSVLELSDETLVARVIEEQTLRTKERKIAQIVRAQKESKKETLLEVSISQRRSGE